ncbi:MAG: hypothetical protein LC797_00845 [Chloroflexi bacterium]|nr:hypothetical protein [Chloroflexota bacterium]
MINRPAASIAAAAIAPSVDRGLEAIDRALNIGVGRLRSRFDRVELGLERLRAHPGRVQAVVQEFQALVERIRHGDVEAGHARS